MRRTNPNLVALGPEDERPVDARRISISIVVVVALLGTSGGAFSVAAVANQRLDQTVEDVAALKARQEPQAVETQHIKDQLGELQAGLDRLERHFGTKP